MLILIDNIITRKKQEDKQKTTYICKNQKKLTEGEEEEEGEGGKGKKLQL